MAVTLAKVAGKLTIGGFALYGLSEVLSSQDNTIKQLAMLDSKTREHIPVNLPEVRFQFPFLVALNAILIENGRQSSLNNYEVF